VVCQPEKVLNCFKDYPVLRSNGQTFSVSVSEHGIPNPTTGHNGFPFSKRRTLKFFACKVHSRFYQMALCSLGRCGRNADAVQALRCTSAGRLDSPSRSAWPLSPPEECLRRAASSLRLSPTAFYLPPCRRGHRSDCLYPFSVSV